MIKYKFVFILLLILGMSEISYIPDKALNTKLINHISSEYKVNPYNAWQYMQLADVAEESLQLPKGIILSIIAVESSFRYNARSPAGAIGLMQITKASGVLPMEPLDYEQNIIAGATLLSDYRNKYGMQKAIMYYNTGMNGSKVAGNRYAKKVQDKHNEILKFL